MPSMQVDHAPDDVAERVVCQSGRGASTAGVSVDYISQDCLGFAQEGNLHARRRRHERIGMGKCRVTSTRENAPAARRTECNGHGDGNADDDDGNMKRITKRPTNSHK